MLCGASLFWNGKTVADAERKNRKPLSVTRDALLTNPPKKAITWVKITDGEVSLSRGLRAQIRGANPDAYHFLYVPVLSPKETARSLTLRQIIGEQPKHLILLRTGDEKRIALYDAMKPLESSSERTMNAWLKQNRDGLIVRPPFTGLLVRRSLDPFAKAVPAKSGFAKDGYILWENEKPPIAASAPVAGGLALLMGVPTLWIFALLIAGKFDPPDDNYGDAPGNAPSSLPTNAAPRRVTIPAPTSSVMPSAPPVE